MGRLDKSEIYGSQAWWDWAGEGWMISENPFLIIDSTLPDLVGERPSTCWLWLDAHHSIPFQQIESNDQYAAPPRFRARMRHNGAYRNNTDPNDDIEPTQFEVWLYDGQLKYTFVVIDEDILPNDAWDPIESPFEPMTPLAGTTTLHDRPDTPDRVYDVLGSSEDWHNPWNPVSNQGVGVPKYAICVKIEDRYGHIVDIQYHNSNRDLGATGVGTGGCDECSQQNRRKGMIRSITLSTYDSDTDTKTTNWTLVYRHKLFWGGVNVSVPAGWSGTADAFKEMFSYPAIDRIYVFEHDAQGNGITPSQIDAMENELVVLEDIEYIESVIDLDQWAPLDDIRGEQISDPSAWAAVAQDLRHIVSYHYDLEVYDSYGSQDPMLAKVRTVRIESDTGDRVVSNKVFKYNPGLVRYQMAGNGSGATNEIAWLELVFSQDDIGKVMAARGLIEEAGDPVIPADFSLNQLALWRQTDDEEFSLDDSNSSAVEQAYREKIRTLASLNIRPGLYEFSGGYTYAQWPNTEPGSGTWDAPSPLGLQSSPATGQSHYLSALGDNFTARNDGNWSTVGTLSMTDPEGAERHYRIHRLMGLPVSGLPSSFISFEPWEDIQGGSPAIDEGQNLGWGLSLDNYSTGSYASEEAPRVDYIHPSVLVNPYYYRSYKSSPSDPMVSVGDLTKPRWISIIDEFESRDAMMEKSELYGGANQTKKGQVSRRVLEMNAYGYILRDRTWTFTGDDYILEGGGLGEEYVYVTVRDYITKKGLAIPAWLSDGQGGISTSRDFVPFLDDVINVEHRSVGWSVAEFYGDQQTPAIDELDNGVVRFSEYKLFADSATVDDVPIEVRFQKVAEGIKKGTYYDGTAFLELQANEPLLYTRQYFRDPDRPADIVADVAFSGLSPQQSPLMTMPLLDQSVDPTITMTRVLSAYKEETGVSLPDQKLISRMMVGPPRQVRPGSEWFYPVEYEHYNDSGITDWAATGQLSHPLSNPSGTDYSNLVTSPPQYDAVNEINDSPFNSLTWTHYNRDRYGRSNYTVLDAESEGVIHLPSVADPMQTVQIAEYPAGWQRFPAAGAGMVDPHNYVTEFVYDEFELSDVYFPNGFRWSRRTLSIDLDDDQIDDLTYEFIFNDLAPTSGGSLYGATSPGQYKLYESENAQGTPKFDKRVRYSDNLDIDATTFMEDFVSAVRAYEDDPDNNPSTFERIAEVMFTVDANGRVQRADLMDYDPLGRPMAIGYTELNDLGELYRERGIDGTIRSQIRNSLGQTLRHYEGTIDRDWYGDPNDPFNPLEDNMVLKERIEYGQGVNDAWLPTVVRRYTDVPLWDNGGYYDHFLQAPSSDTDGIATVTKYDWRMRPVITQNHAKGDPSSSGVLSTTITYLDHADRPVLEANYGVNAPTLSAATDPTAFDELDACPEPKELFNVVVQPTSVVQNVYGPDGTLIERRVYDTSWAYTAMGSPPFISEIMLNGLGGQPVYSQTSGSAAEVSRIDNLGRVAEVASVVPGTVDETVDGFELTRIDNTYDTNGNVTVVRRWERTDPNSTAYALSEANAVCSTTVNWYDEKKRLVATVDLGTEDEGGIYENPDNGRYEWLKQDEPHCLRSNIESGAFDPPNDIVIPVSELAKGQVSIYVYGDGDPSTVANEDNEQLGYTVAPNGMVTKYEYTGTGQVWRKIENYTALNASERRCTQYQYKYGKVQQIIAYDAYPNPPNDTDNDGFLDGTNNYQQTIVAYDDANTEDNELGKYGAVIVDSQFEAVTRDGSLISTVHLPDPDSGIVNQELQSNVIPGDGGLDDTETFRLKYNFAGQVAEREDAEGRVFRYKYDDLGRLYQTQVGYYDQNEVFTPGYASTSGVPSDRVSFIEYEFDSFNRVELVTAKDMSGGTVSQNQYEYDGRANITREYQQYGGPVSTSTSPFIEYTWDYRATEFEQGVPLVQVPHVLHPGYDRVESILYPVPVSTQTARELTLGYGSTDSHSDMMSWLETVDSNLGSPQIAQFAYVGNGRRASHNAADGEITWTLQDTNGIGLDAVDSFGRIWVNGYLKGTSSSLLYRGTNSYDKVGNLTSTIVEQAYYSGWTANDRSRVNTYNLLGQLTGTRVGIATWDTGSSQWVVTDDPMNPTTDNLKREDTWTLDTLGNWVGDQSNSGRVITGDLDSGSIGPSTGFWTWGTDSTNDTLEFTHQTDMRNMIEQFDYDFDGQTPSSAMPVYDAAGNMTSDGTYIYQYDAWNRLVQVKKQSNGSMLRHYTYDGLGRLVKTTSPSNFSNRVEHHHYDGTRRVQTVVVSGLMSGGGAMASGDPEMQSMAMASEPSGESTEPENTNLAFTSSQMGASGQTFVVYREYVWGPGDRGVDEILVYYDATDEAWWCLTDLTGDLVALCDLGGTNDTARVVGQWTYDAYGSVISADHIHSFERPTLGHKGLFLDRLDLVNPLGPQLVPFAQSVYHNRNRAYIPQMGRFLQQDPNQSAMSLIAASPFHGRGAGAIAVAFSLDGLYGDGANLYQYLGSSPWMRNDPTGLYAIGGGSILADIASALTKQYAVNLENDVDWALNWHADDRAHTRGSDKWVLLTFGDAAYRNGVSLATAGVSDLIELIELGLDYIEESWQYTYAGGFGSGISNVVTRALRHGGKSHSYLILQKLVKKGLGLGIQPGNMRVNQQLSNPLTGRAIQVRGLGLKTGIPRPDFQGWLVEGSKLVIHVGEAAVSQSSAAAKQKLALMKRALMEEVRPIARERGLSVEIRIHFAE